MKLSLFTAAILLVLPFLQCFCLESPSSSLVCDQCDQSGQQPDFSACCLKDFAFYIASFENFIPETSCIGTPPEISHDHNLLSRKVQLTDCHIAWFGKLRPHIALRIILV